MVSLSAILGFNWRKARRRKAQITDGDDVQDTVQRIGPLAVHLIRSLTAKVGRVYEEQLPTYEEDDPLRHKP